MFTFCWKCLFDVKQRLSNRSVLLVVSLFVLSLIVSRIYLGKVFGENIVILIARCFDLGQQQMLVRAVMQITWTHFSGRQLYYLRNEPIYVFIVKSSDCVLFVQSWEGFVGKLWFSLVLWAIGLVMLFINRWCVVALDLFGALPVFNSVKSDLFFCPVNLLLQIVELCLKIKIKLTYEFLLLAFWLCLAFQKLLLNF